jgi:hypothetical protein
MSDWKIEHGKVINDFLKYMNNKTDDFILKGGTALLTCYKLDRFSEDIDLDGKNKNIVDYVRSFCDTAGYKFRIAKDTDTVKRYMINYGNSSKPLKVEVSFRRTNIPENETTKINGIAVYNIDSLSIMKANAYTARDKIRDLYDVSFICNNYFEKLSPQTVSVIRNAIEYKGIEQFDYIIRQNEDELIDTAKLANDFLDMYDKLGLLYDSEEKKLFDELAKSEQNNMKQEIKNEQETMTIEEWESEITKELEKGNIGKINIDENIKNEVER